MIHINNNVYHLTDHADDRMSEEGIAKWQVEQTLTNPQRERWNTIQETKVYERSFGIGKDRFTIGVAVDEKGSPYVIVTVYIVEA